MCPIFLGPKIFSRLIFFGSSFSACSGLDFWVLSWLKAYIFRIKLAYHKDELNEDSKWTGFKASLSSI